MMSKVSDLKGAAIRARDGELGSVRDVLFDDRHFVVRWVVVDTGGWLTGRKVVLPPSAFGSATRSPLAFPVDLTKQQVQDSPSLSEHAPVSRQMEADVYGYYGWAPYWSGPAAYAPVGFGAGFAGGLAPPYPVGEPPLGQQGPGVEQERGDPNLRSAREVSGYRIKARDGEIGHVEDLLLDDESWLIGYLVVDTRNWWPGKQVLVSPRWVREVNWAAQQVEIDVDRQQIKAAPEYDATRPLDRADEERLFAHYGHEPYWT